MGCYDTIYLEKKIKCLCGEDMEDFQTKDLGEGLVSYVITKDGRFREDWLRYITDKKRSKKYNFISDIGFGFYTGCHKCDRWHELYAVFLDGKLKKITRRVYKNWGGREEKAERLTL